MKGKNKLEFENLRGLENKIKPGDLMIVARQKGKMNDVILADYSKENGLTQQFDLKSVLTITQQQEIGKIISKFDPEGGLRSKAGIEL